MKIEAYIEARRRQGKKMFAVLLDPENIRLGNGSDNPMSAEAWGKRLSEARPDLIFVGGSTYFHSVAPLIDALRPYTKDTPIVLFPGHPSQFSGKEDATLFLSLISGTNPDTLIGWHVAAARRIREAGGETIPTGYILIDGGKQSTTSRITHTEALPANDTTRIVDTAIAGEMLGLRAIYLEAGSGAAQAVSKALIQEIREAISVPLIVGGGIHSPEEMMAAWQAGADIVVVGNHLEEHPEELGLFTNIYGML